MLSGDWSKFRRANDLTVGDTVIIRRTEDLELLLDFQRGADEEMLSKLSGSHYAIKAIVAHGNSKDPRPLAEKRVSMPPNLWANFMMQLPLRGAGPGKKAGRGVGVEKVASLKSLLQQYADKKFLKDWKPKPVSISLVSGELVEWEPNVVSEVTEEQCNFRYAKRNELFDDGSDVCGCQQFTRVRCLLEGSHHTYYPGQPCGTCAQTGKVEAVSPESTVESSAVRDASKDDMPSVEAPASQLQQDSASDEETLLKGGGVGPSETSSNSDTADNSSESNLAKKTTLIPKKKKCKDCKGTGTFLGDPPFKQELMNGVPYKLRVVAREGAMGSGVIAEEFIPAGKAVCEYGGELIKARETTMREKVYQAGGLFYLYNLNPDHDCAHYWAIDATRVGNVARFINHRCSGFNLECRRIAASCSYKSDSGVPGRIALVTLRDIQPGEMLSYDYDTFNEAEGQIGIEMHKLVKCCCGEEKCKNWVF